jgi:hypothetical protein
VTVILIHHSQKLVDLVYEEFLLLLSVTRPLGAPIIVRVLTDKCICDLNNTLV